jgi:hypothetical protein
MRSSHSLDRLGTAYQDDGSARIARFYSGRFGASADNVAAAYIPPMDGIDVGPVTNFPLSIEILKAAAGGSGSPITMPSNVQADTCARVYAAFLANPHR